MTDNSNRAERHPACVDERELLAMCQIERTRRGGPGGQHRNKVETAVLIVHQPTGIRAEASERRSQHENRRVALFRLRRELAIQHRTSPTDQSATELWHARRRGSRIDVSVDHQDFPCLLTHALNVLHSTEGRLSEAADELGISTSQLIRFLKRDGYVLAAVNRQRESQNWSRIR